MIELIKKQLTYLKKKHKKYSKSVVYNFLLWYLIFTILIRVVLEAKFIHKELYIKPKIMEQKEIAMDYINKELQTITPDKEIQLYYYPESRMNRMTLKSFLITKDEGIRNQLRNMFTQRLLPSWKELYTPVRVISRGANGSTYIMCVADNCEYIVKSSVPFSLDPKIENLPSHQSNEQIVNELYALLDIGDTSLHENVCKVFDFFTDQFGVFYIVMEKLDKCYKAPTILDKIKARLGFGRWANDLNKMKKEVKNIALKFREIGWWHLDLHEDNVMCKIDNGVVVKYILIDWGLSYSETESKLHINNHPWAIHYHKTTGILPETFDDIKNVQNTQLDYWYYIAIEHSQNSLEQKRKK